MELILCFVIGFFLGWSFSMIWVKLTEPIKEKGVIKGYHLHHSILGLISILISFLFIRIILNFVFFLSFGIAIILEHAINHNGFIFITKEISRKI